MIDQQSIHNFFKWADIEKDGWIELNYLQYRNGKYVREAIRYIRDFSQLDATLIEDALLCVGINPRPEPVDFRVSSAKDADIQIYKNLYIDIEPIHAPGTNVTDDELEHSAQLVSYLLGGELSCVPGPVAFSGNGYHVCIAIPAYNHPQEFGNKLQAWYKTRLLPGTKQIREQYGVRIDSTFSPSRQVKLYGTRKPIEGSRLSSFPAVERVESQHFRDYILSFPEKVTKKVAVGINMRGAGTDLTLEDIEAKYGLVR